MTTMQAEHSETMRRKDYTFRRQFDEKPSIVPGCPGWYDNALATQFTTLLMTGQCS